MTLPRNYEKEMAEMLVEFRAKQSELNLVNAECAAVEDEGDKLHEATRRAGHEYERLNMIYIDFVSEQLNPAKNRVLETRSEIQALQAKLLDIQVEFMLRGGQ